MPTAVSSTEHAATLGSGASRLADVRRACADVVTLVRFRAGTVHRKGRTATLAGTFIVLTLAIAVVPAYATGAADQEEGYALDVLLVLPSALAAFVGLTFVSAAASGGGRELLARDPASIHPISPTTDHLGALLLAPLNIAWLLQTWVLLGATAYALGPGPLATAQLVVLAWVLMSTALGQVLAWTLESVRRTRHGIVVVRGMGVALLVGAVAMQQTGRLGDLFDTLPTRRIVQAMVDGFGWSWAGTVAGILGVFVVAVVVGAIPAHLASRRLPRDELQVESGHHPARRDPTGVLGALVRTDRSSVWRAVPMRRGVAVLAIGPGAVALIGNLPWPSLTILPGLVASGGALLYGVNAWCLDSRGALWRESLPVPPTAVFDARAFVLAELLLAGSLCTVLIGGLRAGVPTTTELAAVVSALIVVTLQVVAAAMRWSAKKPYAVDLRSARATPAPPSMMVAYSSRLAVSTTFTGVFFSLVARVDAWALPLICAIPMIAWSGTRLIRARQLWAIPEQRARIITTVAAA